MKLKLASVKSTGTGAWDEVTEHGALKTQLAKTDILSFSNKNLEGDKRVVLFIKEAGEETPKMISLSERLSKLVRKVLREGTKRIEVIKSLLALNVIETEDNVFYLVTKGKPAEGFSLGDLAKEEVVAIAFEDLI